MPRYIHQLAKWPQFSWDQLALANVLAEVRFKQGKLLGSMSGLGFRLKAEASLQNLTQEVIKSSEIEGEILNIEQVRSSIARRLGMDIAGLVPSDRDTDGVVEMMLDATQAYAKKLDADRLFGWHSALFPAGRSGMHKIVVGNWRNNSKDDPMQVVSGPLGRERVHFEAPEAGLVPADMNQFLQWFESLQPIDPVLKAAMAHLWFVTIHPFDDGNGRIARAIADMQLARAEDCEERFYSMSAQIRLERTKYYDVLEETQKGDLDITEWLLWFLECLGRAIDASGETLASAVKKNRLFETSNAAGLNERQKYMTSSKWAKMTKCSQDTATRDIQNLVARGILEKEEAGGRSTSYRLL
jgi:Fic family protein